MKIYNLGIKKSVLKEIPEALPETGLFIACRIGEVHELGKRF